MVKAFVFGKFLPFHKGHEAMINFALSKADFVSVLVCCNDKEDINCDVRTRWIKETFAHEKSIEIKAFNYREAELASTSQSSPEISRQWSVVFKRLFPGHSLVVTSEPYGKFVAEFMNIAHIAFDPQRKHFPISASAIKKNIFLNWQYLANRAKPYFAIKVVVVGTESTGKTTLTNMLAEYYACSAVMEAGRDIIDDSKEFVFDDLQRVAMVHANYIKAAEAGDSALVIIDTDIHITKSYARFVFNKDLEVSEDIYYTNKAALYLYLNNDVNHVQDGTRLHEAERNSLDASHRQVLREHGINVVEIKGNWDERFKAAIKAIDKLCIERMKKPY